MRSNSPHGHMILRVHRVGSHGRWKEPFAFKKKPECDQVLPYTLNYIPFMLHTAQPAAHVVTPAYS